MKTRHLAQHVATAALLLLTPIVHAEKPPAPYPGRPAPEAVFEDLLQAPPGSPMNIADLRGKVVVLEFWATWCPPCIEAIPHLNDLAAQFQDDVIFIAVTDEDRADVEPKLAGLNMHSWIAFDADRSVFENFEVNQWPYTVVIDAQGVVAGNESMPYHLTEKKLDRVVRGQRAQLGGYSPRQTAGMFDWEQQYFPRVPRAAMQRSATNEPSNFAVEPGRLTGLHQPVHGYAMWAWDLGLSRALMHETQDLRDVHFDAVIVIPDGDEQDVKHAMQSLLRDSLGLDIGWEVIETDVLVLSQIDGAPHRLKAEPREIGEQSDEDLSAQHMRSDSPINYSWRRRTATGQRIESLRAFIEESTWTPVIDETGLDGFYSWSLKLPYTDRIDPRRSVSEALGLRLTREVRSTRMLVIKPRASD